MSIQSIVLSALLCMILAAPPLATGAGSEMAASGPVITETYQGGPVAARIGQTITLNLRNPGSGGYSIVKPVYDPKVLKLVSEKVIPAAKAPAPRAGDFGRIVYEFQAIGAGETGLAVQIARPWEKEQPPKDFLKVTIKVTH